MKNANDKGRTTCGGNTRRNGGKSEPILTVSHPFLRKVLRFLENRQEWQGTATELLKAIGDKYTPPNTVTKLLRRFDYEYFYKRDIVIQFRRTNRKA